MVFRIIMLAAALAAFGGAIAVTVGQIRRWLRPGPPPKSDFEKRMRSMEPGVGFWLYSLAILVVTGATFLMAAMHGPLGTDSEPPMFDPPTFSQ